MKHVKKYESFDRPKKGDYVLLRPEMFQDAIQHFIRTEMGKIEHVNNIEDSFPYLVKYYKIPPTLDYYLLLSVYDKDILHYSSNKKELQTIIDANKYNL